MKVGDLVRARHDLDDNQGFVKKGMVGIVTKKNTNWTVLMYDSRKVSKVNVYNLSLARVGDYK